MAVASVSGWAAARARGALRFSTDFRGPGMCLDVVNGGPTNNAAELRPCEGVTGQAWTVRPAAGGFVRLTTEFRGAGMCLDVVNGGPRNNAVELRPCEDRSGQLWRMTPGPRGFVRLPTQFRGPRVCLDVVNGGPRNNAAELRPCRNLPASSGAHAPVLSARTACVVREALLHARQALFGALPGQNPPGTLSAHWVSPRTPRTGAALGEDPT
ncbi:MAG: RICIN domain-containing protein [Polyangiales bacterium]